MRRKKTILLVLIIAASLAAWFVFRHRETSLEWAQKTSGIWLPSGIKAVNSYYDDTHVATHALLAPNTIDDFAKKFNFTPFSWSPELSRFAGDLESRFPPIPQSTNLVAVGGRSAVNKWFYVLDKNSGQLWFTVEYPDNAGDAP